MAGGGGGRRGTGGGGRARKTTSERGEGTGGDRNLRSKWKQELKSKSYFLFVSFVLLCFGMGLKVSESTSVCLIEMFKTYIITHWDWLPSLKRKKGGQGLICVTLDS